MNKQYLWTAAALTAGVLATTQTFAQVTLNVTDNTIVTAINGQEVKNGLLSKPQKTYKLEPGKHVITAKYNRLYELRGDNHDVLRSSNISVPVELADNQTYVLDMLGQPEDYNAAKEYVKQPTLAVLQGKQIIASQQATSNSSSSIFSGLGNALGGVFGGSSKAVEANQQTINALGQSGGAIPAINQPSNQSGNQPVATTVSSSDNLDQFMQLWLRATPAERDKIRQWVQK